MLSFSKITLKSKQSIYVYSKSFIKTDGGGHIYGPGFFKSREGGIAGASYGGQGGFIVPQNLRTSFNSVYGNYHMGPRSLPEYT